jgi:hypothetical protein
MANITETTPVESDVYDIAAPRPEALIQSLRAFGYDLSTAIADILDNSISASSKNIAIDFFWNAEDSYISIRDDGCGMSEDELINAMRPGSRSPLEVRSKNDLGRFGLGLKTASFSQCTKLTVASRTKGGSYSTRCWDLSYVTQCGEWCLDPLILNSRIRDIYGNKFITTSGFN